MAEIDSAEAAYEQAEAAYLAGIRTGSGRDELTALASELAANASAWNAAAYRAYHSASGTERGDLDWLTERTEVLSELWADVLAAYQGAAR